MAAPTITAATGAFAKRWRRLRQTPAAVGDSSRGLGVAVWWCDGCVASSSCQPDGTGSGTLTIPQHSTIQPKVPPR